MTATTPPPTTSEKARYWLAVNGPTCVAGIFPSARPPVVSPTPQTLIGYETPEEQRAAQRLLLEGSMAKVRRYMTKELPARVRRSEVAVVTPPDPEPYTTGTTLWTVA